MPKENSTLIAVVLDRSGSMQPLREATVAGLNQFLRGQRELAGTALLHFVQFDDQYEVKRHFEDLKQVPDLTQDDFQPRGSTALLDAIGRTIVEVGARLASTPEASRPSKIIFVIQTDGFENASHEYNYAKIQEMISHQRDKYAWDFVFLGANQDAIATGGMLGIQAGATISYNANALSTQKTFQMVNRSVASSRIKGAGGQAVFTAAAQNYVSNDQVGINAALDLSLDPVDPSDPSGGAVTPDSSSKGT